MRVFLKGEGTPIPDQALPDPNLDFNLPSQLLLLTNGVPFEKTEYIAAGYTHYEVWCVGAAGGRGGDGSAEVEKVYLKTRHSVPQDVWDLHLKGIRAQSVLNNNGEFDHVYAYSTSYYPGIPNGGLLTAPQFEEYINPTHEFDFYELTEMTLTPATYAIGGGGGGGGLHRFVGVLADLPASVPVVVGQVGGDAAPGQVRQNGVWTPSGYFNTVTVPPGYPNPPPENWSYPNGIQTYVNQITNWFWIYTYDVSTEVSFSVPLPGTNGGASSFGTVCEASGGKGGGPGKVWDGTKYGMGDGGAGGLGGSLVAGGGGAGSTNAGVDGSNGLWSPDTSIGGGGGGGRASSGGLGSYSFGDTSVYGQRQDNQDLVPGGGGGARALSYLKFGSKAPGYSPNGLVALRLMKIV